MCGRYITPEQADIERHWNLTPDSAYRQSFNFAPSQTTCVISLGDDNEFQMDAAKWGFQPHWANRAWINARSETVFESRAFGTAAKRHRCLVPAIGWYEWAGEKPKQPYVFHQPGFKVFAFAGICTTRPTDDGPIQTFAILTRAAISGLAAIHSRMPVLLNEQGYRQWLDANSTPEQIAALFAVPPGKIDHYAVSDFVNKPANNSAECIRPMASI